MNTFFRILVLLLLLAAAGAKAQCPPNIGFEDGTFKNWVCSIGEIDKFGVIGVYSDKPTPSRQTLYKKGDTTIDKYGHFPVVCPNGSGYSVRLGNDEAFHQAERLSYTYNIPPGQTLTLILNYAVVMAYPILHADFEQPRFTARVFNLTDGDGLPITCPNLDFIAAADIGFTRSAVWSRTGAGVVYKEWAATTINLEGYGGKTIRLDLTTNDCTHTDFFGYAYFDISETCETPITGNTYCQGQPEVTLSGPGTYANYKWYLGPNASGPVIGTKQTLTLPSPPDQTKYTLYVEPYPGLGCEGILHTTINKIPNPFTMKVISNIVACAGSAVDLTAATVTEGSTPGFTFTYYTDKTALNYLYLPQAITKPGIYYIKGASPEGCINVLPIEVKFIDIPTISSIPAKTALYPNTVDISIPNNNNLTYSYYKDVAATTNLYNYATIDKSGTYYIRATSTLTGCQSAVVPVKVTIGSPTKFTLTVPNTFTPNGDGVNDVLNIGLSGYLTFGNFKVFNRYGQIVFTSSAQTESWNGTFNGHLLPVGAYYWIFEGTDSYFNIPVRKSGEVTIIR
jgi:gliding motility-associated-like protein